MNANIFDYATVALGVTILGFGEEWITFKPKAL